MGLGREHRSLPIPESTHPKGAHVHKHGLSFRCADDSTEEGDTSMKVRLLRGDKLSAVEYNHGLIKDAHHRAEAMRKLYRLDKPTDLNPSDGVIVIDASSFYQE